MTSALRTTIVKLDDLIVYEHCLPCPLNHAVPSGPHINIFARELVSPSHDRLTQPMLLYLQGGPGFESPRPVGRSGWIDHALKTHRVLLLDQRGTGLSAPISPVVLSALGSADVQLQYLTQFRADQIVLDAEMYRRVLLGEDAQWDILGQSFGGFCALHYLSAHPAGLRNALFTGGLPPLSGGPDPVYEALFPRVEARTDAYFERYPADRGVLARLAHYAESHEVFLPSGTRLRGRTLQQLGMLLGASDGFEKLHYCLEQIGPEHHAITRLPYRFRVALDALLPFNTHPIYALLHEAIYCQKAASRWSAQRIRDAHAYAALFTASDFQFSGEMVFPWMFEDYGELRASREVADAVAEYDAWPSLYDTDALRLNQVPSAAAIYTQDMYVERTLSEETAQAVGAMSTWVTGAHEHNGLRVDGAHILAKLQSMVPWPSNDPENGAAGPESAGA
ncbi:MAG: alpha/beta fold hydrolase [Myxococcota bacterium]|nr:alpha/beta fold hydrolase [Myxococcota bacterium]